MRHLTILLLLALPLSARPQDEKEDPRPAHLRDLAARALTAPPELAADILLRLLPDVPPAARAWKFELLDQAFQLASSASQPYPRTGAIYTDSARGLVARAADLKLDTLSLQLRVVEALLPLDPARARQRFDEITLPLPTNTACSEPFVPVYEPYFQLLLQILDRTFSPAERADGEPARLLARKVSAVRDLSQLAPALSAVLRAQDAQALLLLAESLRTLPAGPRSAQAFALPPSSIPLLLDQGPSGLLFLQTYRDALLAAYNRRLCAPLPGSRAKTPLTTNLEAFNAAAAKLPELKPLAASDFKDVEPEPSYEEKFFWTSPTAGHVLLELKWLTHGNRTLNGTQQTNPWTAAERATPEWESRALDLLNALDAWKPKDESSPLDYLAMKAATYSLVAAKAQAGPLRNRALTDLLAHLNAAWPPADLSAWLFQLHRTLSEAPEEDYPAYLDALAASPNPAFSLYAQLYKTTSASPRRPKRQ